jgi:hypothetical protein
MRSSPARKWPHHWAKLPYAIEIDGLIVLRLLNYSRQLITVAMSLHWAAAARQR